MELCYSFYQTDLKKKFPKIKSVVSNNTIVKKITLHKDFAVCRKLFFKKPLIFNVDFELQTCSY